MDSAPFRNFSKHLIESNPCLGAVQGTQVLSLGRGDPLEKEMAAHSSILAWKSHGQTSQAGCRPCGRVVRPHVRD